ncbi:hypothetical protein Tco_0736312 [Tanacetum coccineum]
MEHSWPLGEVLLEITVREGARSKMETLNFVIVRSDSPYNFLLGRTTMQNMDIVVSTIHAATKFQTLMAWAWCTQAIAQGESKIELLQANADVFAWTYANITGVPRILVIDGKPFGTKHKLNEYKNIEPIKHKQRGLAPEWNAAACKEVDKLTEAGILREVLYQTWVESLSGFQLKCFLDAYKGYLQIEMAEEEEEKTAFYKAFSKQIGRNLKANVDDMVIKSKNEEDLLLDIQETFDQLRAINVKLNSKKCSFGVEER